MATAQNHPKARTAEPVFDQQARRLADRLSMAIYASPVGVHGAFSFMSAAVERLLGYPRQQWLSDHKLWLASLHPDDRWSAIRGTARMRKYGRPLKLTYRLRDARQQWHWIED